MPHSHGTPGLKNMEEHGGRKGLVVRPTAGKGKVEDDVFSAYGDTGPRRVVAKTPFDKVMLDRELAELWDDEDGMDFVMGCEENAVEMDINEDEDKVEDTVNDRVDLEEPSTRITVMNDHSAAETAIVMTILIEMNDHRAAETAVATGIPDTNYHSAAGSFPSSGNFPSTSHRGREITRNFQSEESEGEDEEDSKGERYRSPTLGASERRGEL